MEPRTLAALQVKEQFSELLEEVQRGQSFFITKDGEPIAQLAPLDRVQVRPKFGCGKGTFTRVADDFDSPLEEFSEHMK